jgi:hypothetical protein
MTRSITHITRCLLCVLLLAASAISQNNFNAARGFTTTIVASDVGLLQANHITYHQLAWTVTGSPASCTASLDSSPDGITWTVGGIITGQTCTTLGSSAVVNANAAWIRINVTALSASASVTVNYTGWSSNPAGTGGVTAIAKGAVPVGNSAGNGVVSSTYVVPVDAFCLPYVQWTDIGICINAVATAYPNSKIDASGLPTKVYLNSPMITPAGYTMTAAGNASGGSTVYTGTFPVTPTLAGYTILIAGFANGANNGSFLISASTSTTITVNNAGGVSQSGQTAFGALSGTFNGKLSLGSTVFFINNVTGLQTFGTGVDVEGIGRGSFAGAVTYVAGAGTIFHECSSTDTAPGDFGVAGPCNNTAYTAVLTADTFNYPPILAANSYLPSVGTVGAGGITALGTRISGVVFECGMNANATGLGNFNAQEQSKFDNIQGVDCSGSGDICVALGGGTGGAQNFWITDGQCTTLSGKTNVASAVGIQIWGGTGNGMPSIIEKFSVVNNAGGTLPNYDIQYVGGTTNIGEILMMGIHLESAGIDGIAMGIVTVKGVDQGGAANGLTIIDANCGPGFTGGGASGCYHIYTGVIGTGTAAVTNIQILGSESTNATPVNLITDANNTSIPVATKFVARYETDGTAAGGKVISDTSGTNITNFAGQIKALQGQFTTSLQSKAYTSATNCSAVGTSASPSVAACGSSASGSFSCATNAVTTCTVNTTAVTANSQIFITQREDTTTGTRLAVTCNTTASAIVASENISAVVAGTSFSFLLTQPVTNPNCYSYFIVN